MPRSSRLLALSGAISTSMNYSGPSLAAFPPGLAGDTIRERSLIHGHLSL